MNILTIAKMILTPGDIWLDLEKARPSLASLFLFHIFPLSALPPLLLYHAGTHYGDAFAAGFGAKPWVTIASAFYLAEVFTVFGMGWIIRQVAAIYKVNVSKYDAYLLAGISPTPLWLSSLALLVPNLAFSISIVLLALAVTCITVYRGVYALCHMHEEITAAAITQTVMGAGLIAWALLLLIIVAL
jgi:hypothetical protein